MGKPKMDLIPEPKPEKKFQQLRLTFSPAAQKAIDDFRESRGYSVQNGKIILNSKKKTTSTVQTQTAGSMMWDQFVNQPGSSSSTGTTTASAVFNNEADLTAHPQWQQQQQQFPMSSNEFSTTTLDTWTDDDLCNFLLEEGGQINFTDLSCFPSSGEIDEILNTLQGSGMTTSIFTSAAPGKGKGTSQLGKDKVNKTI